MIGIYDIYSRLLFSDSRLANFQLAVKEALRLRVSLEFADFRSQDLRDLDFSGQNLIGCSFDGADIRGANFEEAEIIGASFRGALVNGATTWRGVHFRGGELEGLEFPASIA